MGWFSDFISNPIERLSTDISNPGGAVEGLVKGVGDLVYYVAVEADSVFEF